MEKEYKLYKAIVEAEGDAIVVIQDKIIKYANQRVSDLSGFSQDEVLGKDFISFVPEDKKKELLQKHKERMEGRRIHDFYETEIVAKDGLIVPVEVNAAFIEYEGGPAGLVILRDIREKKKLERILKRSKEHLNRAQAVAHIGSWYLDISKNELWWSNETYRIFNIPQGEELTYEKFLSLVYEDDKEKVNEAWSKALRHVPYDIEHRVQVGGEIKWVRERAEVVFDHHGDPIEGIGTVQDITESKKNEEALRKSEELYRTLAEAAHDMIFVIDVDGVIEYVNNFSTAFLRRSKEEIIGKRMVDLFPPDIAERQWRNITKVLEEKTSAYFENTSNPNGEENWLGTWLVPLLDSEGKPRGVMGVSRDITDRKRAEGALQTSEALFRGVIEQSPFSTQFFRPNGILVGINDAFRKFWGVTKELEERVMGNYNILEDEQLKAIGVMPKIERGFSGEFSEIPAIFYDPEKTPGLKKAGLSARWAAGYIWPIRDDQGNIQQVVLMHEDVTRRKEVEFELEKKVSELQNAQKATMNLVDDLRIQREGAEDAHIRLNAILESVGEGVVAIDGSGNDTITFVNGPAQEMFGLKHDEMVGRTYHEVWSMQDSAGNRLNEEDRAIAKALRTHKPVMTSDYFYVRKDGTRFPVYISIQPIILNGRIVGVLDVFRDISREKQLERARNELISLASHQLRTPLTIISWYAEELVTGTSFERLTPEQREYVQEIYTGNKRMIALLNDMLNVSRLELGTFVVRPEKMKLSDAIANVVSGLSTLLKEKRIEASISHDNPDLELELDQRVIQLVFTNIITNAIKYSYEKSRVEIVTKKEEQSVQIRVRDWGCGIPQEIKHRIFEKLFRADNARIMDPGGSGLGLYIAKLIVDQVGGRIWFESEEGRGTTFFVELPLKMKKGGAEEKREGS